MTKTQAKTTPETAPADSIIAPNTVITLTLPWSEVEPVYKEVLKKLAKKVKSPGFRPGKVPAHIALETIGSENLNEEILKKILPNHYQEAVNAQNKKPLTYPEFRALSVEMNKDWIIEAHIAEKPEVVLKDYQKIAKKSMEVVKSEPAGHKHEHAHVEEKAQDAPKPTPEQLKAEQDEHTLQHIFRDLISVIKPRIPELLIKEEARGELEQLVRSLNQVQMSLDGYLERRQITFEQLSGELASQALGRLQLEFILQAIIEQENLKAEDKDYEEYFARIKDEKTRKEQSQNPDYRNYIGSLIVRKKVADHLLSL